MSTLKIKISTKDDDFKISLGHDEFDESKTFEGMKKEILSDFEMIYETLEKKSKSKWTECKTRIKKLSKLLIEPFSKKIKVANKIRFIVDYKLLKCAMDILEIDNIPIFLNSQVSYSLSDIDVEDKPEIEINSALIIADLTADPEEACKKVRDMIEESEYIDVKKASLEDVIETDVDLLLVSAHGELEDDMSGSIAFTDDIYLSSDELETIDVSFVYCDSCQMGINTDFIETFEEEGTSCFYMAPIISNDAGDSSTKTMVWFFEDILDNKNPIQSIFQTKKKLFEFYSKSKLDEVAIYNKAFPFRIYEFSTEEDD